RRDSLVDAVPGDDLTAPHPGLNCLGHAPVLRVFDAAAGVVADGHVPAAVPADRQALQQGWTLTGGSGFALSTPGLGTFAELALVGLESLPGDVARVGIRDEGDPLVFRHLDPCGLAVGPRTPAVPAVEERTGVA